MNSTIANYSYDYMSRRVEKAVGNVTNKYFYDGWNLVSETTINNSQLTTNYFVFGLDLSGTLQGAGGIGGLLQTISGTNCYYSFADGNGNVSEMLDAGGNVVAHYEYSPYGEVTAKSGSKANDFKIRFSSKYWDDESGLGYWIMRYYHPETGRWINRDPMEEDGGLLLYGFVGNDGIDAYDLLGEKIYIKEADFDEWKKPPAKAPSYLGGETVVLLELIHGITGPKSGWHTTAEAKREYGDSCSVNVHGDLTGYWWYRPGNRAHEFLHVGIWTKAWDRWRQFVNDIDPDKIVCCPDAECKAEWILWYSSMAHALSMVRHGQLDKATYPSLWTPGQQRELASWSRFFNEMIKNKPDCEMSDTTPTGNIGEVPEQPVPPFPVQGTPVPEQPPGSILIPRNGRRHSGDWTSPPGIVVTF